jgi:gamma-glutamyltranspeptidase/glutathione hydrolase
VDVAIAAIFAALVSEPGISSLGGGAFVTIAAEGQAPVTVDGSVAVPGLGRDPSAPIADPVHLFLEYAGGTDMLIGPASVAVPGTLTALELAHQRFGRLPWAEVVAPSVQLARDGFPLGSAAAHYLGFASEPLFGLDSSAAAVLTGMDGIALGPGDRMRMPELADFLERVAIEGAAALMSGDVAKNLVEQMYEQGALLTAADLAEYEPAIRPALQVRVSDWTFATNPAPAVGGPVLGAMLTLLRAGRDGHVPLRDLVAVQRDVLTYRVRELDRAPDRVAAARAMLEAAASGPLRGTKAPSTVHVSAVDAKGQACAITASAGYGAGVSAPGTGVWLNNCLGEPELIRGTLTPGERLVSNMTPTVGWHADGRVLAIGSPGAARIAMAVLQTLAGLIAGDSLVEAIRRPRVHVSVTDDGTATRVEYERDVEGRDGVAPDLPWREHEPLAMFFGGVAAALLGPEGALAAAADPRRDGAVVLT